LTKLRAFHVPATRPRPYSHDWEEDWTSILLFGGGVHGSGESEKLLTEVVCSDEAVRFEC